MRAKVGPLNTRIQFLKQVQTTDENFGTTTGGWVPHADAWSHREDLMPSKDEGVLTGAVETASIRTRFRFRFRPDITSDMRVKVFHPIQRTMEIIGGPVEIGDRQSFMEILCQEVSTHG